ncbi:KxYKxGKxW signal peptide domain-containing protein [Leuconostoc citreum]|uniref:KxYKxGKxW signal peptide domain-containing protein n=1 Tax=Leuconostoc citreum TaxID=33964 RepID=UPI000BFEC83F|nr:KxYKxGKxW signal peptide domain-containing protein [Leuconostoc citreum]
MQNSKKYKLYKSGKLWVVGAVAVAGIALSANTTQVSADNVSNADAQAVKTTDARQNDKQVQLASSTDQTKTDYTAKPATVSSTAEKSTVPTTAGSNVTQDQAKDSVDKAQDTVKNDADIASKAGVDVTTGKTTDVTINDDNASSKTDEVLSDLSKQDQAVKEATAKQEANKQAKQTADKQHDEAVKQGQADLNKATNDLDKQVNDTKKAGIEVSIVVAHQSPAYQDLKGLEGQPLLDAMAHNIEVYNKTVADATAMSQQDKQTLANLTAEYKQKVAQYQAEKARVDKENADKKAAYEKALQDYLNATHHNTVMQAKTDTDMANGQYQTFMTSDVNQNTGEFSLKHDMNDGVSIIGRGELKGKVNYQVVSNEDGTETIKVTSIDLYSYTYTNLNYNTAVNQNINFHVYDNNGNELFSVYHDGQSSFSRKINKNFKLNKSIKLTPGQQSDLFDFLKIDDNWIYNTHGKVFIAFQNTNKAPQLPNYAPQPTAPAIPKAEVHQVSVDELPTPDAPVAPKATVTKVTVDELPQAETPAPQKVDVHYYNVHTTPDVPAPTHTTSAPKAKVTQASILPHTGANEKTGSSMLSALVGIASLGLLGAINKFKKQK